MTAEPPVTYELTLFVSGASDLSARAIADARSLCDADGPGRCHLTVVDVHDDPAALPGGPMIATPTLVRRQPLPERKVTGDLSNRAKVRLALGLPPVGDTSRRAG